VAVPFSSRVLPPLTRLGLVFLLAGAAGDVLFHSLPVPWAHDLEPLLGTNAIRAHLTTLLGMTLMLAGVIARGLRTRNHSRTRRT